MRRHWGTSDRRASVPHPHYGDAMEDAYLARRFALLEQHVKLLSEKAGVPCPTFGSDVGTAPATQFEGGVPTEVVALARGGNAIAAIKLFRDLTGAGLREAKEVVDSL